LFYWLFYTEWIALTVLLLGAKSNGESSLVIVARTFHGICVVRGVFCGRWLMAASK
jgi:hypothetical protein